MTAGGGIFNDVRGTIDIPRGGGIFIDLRGVVPRPRGGGVFLDERGSVVPFTSQGAPLQHASAFAGGARQGAPIQQVAAFAGGVRQGVSLQHVSALAGGARQGGSLQHVAAFLGGERQGVPFQHVAADVDFLEPIVSVPVAVQRDALTTFLVDVTFDVISPDGFNGTLLVEWSRGPVGPWNPATVQPFDRKHDADVPLTGLPVVAPGKEFNYVWNAFADLPEGEFEDIHVRLTVENSA